MEPVAQGGRGLSHTGGVQEAAGEPSDSVDRTSVRKHILEELTHSALISLVQVHSEDVNLDFEGSSFQEAIRTVTAPGKMILRCMPKDYLLGSKVAWQ